MAAGARREDRIERWLRQARDKARCLTLHADRTGEGRDTLMVVNDVQVLRQEPAAVAREVSACIVDEATACGHVLRGTLVLELEGGDEITTTVQARPDPSRMSDEESDGFGVENLSGTTQSQVIQAQRHVEALVRMSVQERDTTLSGVGKIVSHVCQLVESSLERQRAEERRADDYRQREEDLRAELAELRAAVEAAQADDDGWQMPPHMEQLLTAAVTRLASGALVPQTPDKTNPN